MGRVLTGYAKAAVVVASLAAALSVTSCSDGAEAEPTPTSTSTESMSSPSPSSSTSSTSSSGSSTSSSTGTVNVPAAARAHTEEGAKAFAEFYLSTYSQAAVRADSSPLVSLSDTTCGGCKSLIDLINGYKAKGQHADSASMVLDDSVLRADSSSNRPVVDVLAKDKKKRILNADGTVAKTVAGAYINFRLTLVWTRDGWKVNDLRVVQ